MHKGSIIPRGIGALGYTLQRPTEDRFLMTRRELENKLAILLGGRAAEQLCFGQLSTGAADDLGRAADIARSMVTRYAMAPELGHTAFEDEPQSYLGQAYPAATRRSYSEETARAIDTALRGLVDDAFDRAHRILETNRALLDQSAELLLAKETLSEGDLTPLFEKVQAEPDPAA